MTNNFYSEIKKSHPTYTVASPRGNLALAIKLTIFFGKKWKQQFYFCNLWS